MLNEYKTRIVENKLSISTDVNEFVYLEGIKWCGKKSIAEQYKENKIIVCEPDDSDNKNILLHINNTIKKLRIRPMSLYETGDSTGVISLEQLCNNNIEFQKVTKQSTEELAKVIIRGGFPESVYNTNVNENTIPKRYIDTIFDDIVIFDKTRRDHLKMRYTLEAIARNESTEMSINKIRDDIYTYSDVELDLTTLSVYLKLFKELFVSDNLKSFVTIPLISTRVKLTEKRYLSDPSISAALLNLTPASLMKNVKMFERFFKSICVRDLRIYADAFDASVYHYHDYLGREVDCVIELKDKSWCAFEFVVQKSKIEQSVKKLLNLQRSIQREMNKGNSMLRLPNVLCIICACEGEIYQRTDGVYIIPINCLKN